MNKIGFIGLGHMGSHMARNLIKNGHTVMGFDLNQDLLNEHTKAGGIAATSISEVAKFADIIITMLPKGKHVASVCDGNAGIFNNAKPHTLVIDSSTIDVETSKRLAKDAKLKNISFIDAPVSGGVYGAKDATLSFMVGGTKSDFERALPILSHMGKNIIYVGANGSGLSIKIANNMILGITLIGVSEAFNLLRKTGIDPSIFYKIASVSTASCWALNNYCPVPIPGLETPANNNYEPGASASTLLKDLKLSQDLAQQYEVSTPLGSLSKSIYELIELQNLGDKDMSIVYQFLSGEQ